MGNGLSLVRSQLRCSLAASGADARWPHCGIVRALSCVRRASPAQAVAVGIPLIGGTVSGLSTIKEIPKW